MTKYRKQHQQWCDNREIKNLGCPNKGRYFFDCDDCYAEFLEKENSKKDRVIKESK